MLVSVLFNTQKPYTATFDPEVSDPQDELPILVSGGSLTLHLSVTEARTLATQLENAAAAVSLARARNLPGNDHE